MANVRSNLNSVPNCAYNLTALKEHWNTCFQRWRHHQQQQQQKPHKVFQQSAEHSAKAYTNFAKRTNKHFHNFHTRLKQLFAYKGRKVKREKVEIVAKLITATLVATETTQIIQTNTIETMTIHDNTFMEVRDEFPDIDAEVRGILMARAQKGATISNIKEDYFKQTGMHFPIYKNIVDFLLSIPSVSAVCSDRGTLIFNIVPTDKTKHLYELVLQQKAERTSFGSQVSSQRLSSLDGNGFHSTKYSWRNRQYLRGNRLSFGQQMAAGPPPSSHSNDYNNNNNINHTNNIGSQRNGSAIPKTTITTTTPLTKVPFKKIEPVVVCIGDSEKSQSQTESEGFVENNFIYQDNCNYLFNRLCNQRNNLPPLGIATGPANEQHAKLPDDANNLDVINNYQQHKQYQDPIFVDCAADELMPPPQAVPPARLSNPFRNATTSSPIRSVLTSNDSLFDSANYNAHIFDFQLLGDDFFLYMARMELGCKFQKNQKVLQSGLCISGQTIRAACRNVQKMANSNRSVIVNIGSVDIMQGRHLVQIEHEYRQLINILEKKNMHPVLTTLAPLANYGYDKQMKEKIERFNGYIRRMQPVYPVIDIWTCMVNESTQTLFDCYQKEPRVVTGSKEPHVFWNKVGRQRVLHMIVSSIEY